MMPPVRYDFGDISVYISPIERRCDESRSQSERRVTDAIISHVLGDGVHVGHHSSGAPFLIGSDLFVSVSHSRLYVAVALSKSGPIGVDIEEYRSQLDRVASRVLSDAELAFYANQKDGLLRAWTLKEALYKAALTPGLDFRRDIILPLSDETPIACVCNKPYAVSSIPVSDQSLLSLARPV